MSGEAILLSGDQIATYATTKVTYDSDGNTIRLNGYQTLGDSDSRYFLVRTQGDGDTVTNGQWFEVREAVEDENGNLVPGNVVLSANYATPDGYEGICGGDDYQIFGVFGGTKFAVNLDGFPKQGGTYTFPHDTEACEQGDGELQMSEISAASPATAVCFARGTLVDTPEGERAIETLQPGDTVLTADHGAQVIRWIGSTCVRLHARNRHLRPVTIRAGALGRGLPARDVTVSPAHQVVIGGGALELHLGTGEALAAARFLENGSTIARDDSAAEVEYWHIVFDRHEIVFTSGLATESFHPGGYALTALGQAQRQELIELFPEWSARNAPAYGETARPVLRRFEARALPEMLAA